VKYHKLGCYKDDGKNPRPLPKLLLTDRDPKSPVFSSIRVDWGKWDSYMSDLVCRCAEKAAENNYRFFGLQYYGKYFAISILGSILEFFHAVLAVNWVSGWNLKERPGHSNKDAEQCFPTKVTPFKSVRAATLSWPSCGAVYCVVHCCLIFCEIALGWNQYWMAHRLCVQRSWKKELNCTRLKSREETQSEIPKYYRPNEN